jgi:hypothetical protein
MSDTEQYAKYFSAGMKIGVGIPMQNNELFRDWAIIHTIEEDLAELQLSRDVLPVDVDMQTGKVLELRCGKEGKGYRCSGVYIADGEDGNIQIRLTGEVNSNELREFYRIDLFLPFRGQVAKDGNLDAVLKEWRTRRQERQVYENKRKEEFEKKRRDTLFQTAEGAFDVVDENGQVVRVVPEMEELELYDPSWKGEMASVINLSAGGFKFVTTEHFELGDIIFQEVFLPSTPPRIMDIVARVVFKNRNYSYGNDVEYDNIATQFLFIEERDRDEIVRHISNVELMRIRLLRQNAIATGEFTSGLLKPLKMIGAAVGLVTMIVIITLLLLSYSRQNIKNEIQESFESGIRKYMDRFK